MKGLSAGALTIGAFAALLSPEALGKLTGTQVFWLLLVALVIAALSEGLLPKRKSDGGDDASKP